MLRAVDFNNLPAKTRTEINRQTDEKFWKAHKEWEQKHLAEDSPLELRQEWMRMREGILNLQINANTEDDDFEKDINNLVKKEAGKIEANAAKVKSRNDTYEANAKAELARQSNLNETAIKSTEDTANTALKSQITDLANNISAVSAAQAEGDGLWDVTYETRQEGLAPVYAEGAGDFTGERYQAWLATHNTKAPDTWSPQKDSGFRNRGEAQKAANKYKGNNNYRNVRVVQVSGNNGPSGQPNLLADLTGFIEKHMPTNEYQYPKNKGEALDQAVQYQSDYGKGKIGGTIGAPEFGNHFALRGERTFRLRVLL